MEGRRDRSAVLRNSVPIGKIDLHAPSSCPPSLKPNSTSIAPTHQVSHSGCHCIKMALILLRTSQASMTYLRPLFSSAVEMCASFSTTSSSSAGKSYISYLRLTCLRVCLLSSIRSLSVWACQLEEETLHCHDRTEVARL